MKALILAVLIGATCGVLMTAATPSPIAMPTAPTPPVLFIATVAALQPPPDESTVPDSEKRIPPGHYCKAKDVPIGPKETRAHSCDCKFSCSIDEQGNVSEHESPDCQAFCHLNGRRCTCHTEEPCQGAMHGNALMDMNGRVVAVARRK